MKIKIKKQQTNPLKTVQKIDSKITKYRIECNKLLLKASHGSTQCPPKV